MSLALLVFAIVAVGSLLQRVSGMGLGLVAGSILSVAMGPVEGILVVNLLAAINATMTTVIVRKNVDWQKFFLIAPVVVLGAIPGAWLITVVSGAMLQVVVGSLLLSALAIVTFGVQRIPHAQGKIPAVITGVIAGFMNTLAGIAGPAITVYAQVSRWSQVPFAATLQPIFIVSGLVSLTVKIVSGAGTVASVSSWVWFFGIFGMIAGISIGARASQKIPRPTARKISLSVATLGGIMVLVRGLVGLF
ncbi:sulfite exporter TauE/SafE family protein [Corynebacterium pseudotuberculosis]|uniref:Probable membrane transporter protein n=1 Tax=Corynebacterium pseudotuberculosis 258 TaxID=1168865 RepID=A0AAU8PM45_CORPS|nr:sulfite exporter TauE/SafE family protein [Corynebacterium pseudotuberculosis]AEQ06481.1 TSUP family transporter [Corynebacterium pseudotuberculosis CIP 52.97]AFB72266.1 TSUP family transporter [Corynebacterium pseudotuberculosis 316]AFH90751.1 TSUP family transporter [Corynebacterium pseudotuberculosis 31]AFK16566.1 TSUP family transporter [Corynebacterium pseudotuberculosis 258]AMN69916.1 TSUP family transporter [Corynebacterium pseudotuberculosis]